MGGEECEDVGGEGVWGVGVRRLVYMYTLHWWVRTCVRVGGCDGVRVEGCGVRHVRVCSC